MTARRVGLIVLTMALMTVPVLAQDPVRFSSGTAAVRVDVLVTTANRPVSGLKASDFVLRDNGVVQHVTDVSQETLPLSVFCVLDLSSSVKGRPLERLKDATAALFGTLRDRDRAALMTFASRVTLHTPLTGDVTRLRSLVQGVQAEGQTSFIDATYAGLALRESDDGRALMVLFSDGDDTSSWLRAQTVIEAAQRADVVIYPVTVKPAVGPAMAWAARSGPNGMMSTTIVGPPPPDPTPGKLLDAFADETGGRVLYAENEEKLQATFIQVLDEFRQRYVLSYSPTNVSSSGWHTIDVKVGVRGATVKSRRGYAAIDPASPGGATKEQPR